MKQRYSSLDVRIIAHELSNSLVTLRLQNIYDLSSKVFLIKFAKLDIKKQIVIDAGNRCHITEYSRATAASPSVFVQSLRKRLKTRRVTSVSQIGTDRVIEFQFSDGQYRLFIEFFASGSIILTDNELKILTLLRVLPGFEGQEEHRVGLQYVLDNRQNYKEIPPLTIKLLQNAMQIGIDKYGNGREKDTSLKKKHYLLRKTLAFSITEFPPTLVDHALRVTGFDSKYLPIDILQDNTLLDHLLRSMRYAQQLVEEITRHEIVKGYIFAKKKPGYEESTKDIQDIDFLIYDEFHPFRPLQLENDPTLVSLEIEGYNKTVDNFFSSIEGQKSESKLEERELIAKRKLDAVRQEQAKRLEGFQQIQTLNERRAGAIQANIERVQEAMDAVNDLISQGIDWVEIAKLIEVEQRMKSPVALTIKLPLKLHENTITLTLDEVSLDDENSLGSDTNSESSDSDDQDLKSQEDRPKKADMRLAVDVNLGISPWANARLYFDERRTAINKVEKTKESSAIAFKSQEAKIKENLRTSLKKEKPVLRPIRQSIWFEKFYWFLSSDRYLVLAGKDTTQNEILYKKYLKKGDIYVSADVDGAAIVVIKNKANSTDAPIPPSTLTEAGVLAISCSSAWDSKAIMSAWWVNTEQVSKSTPTGDFLPTGCFHIRGCKNFLPPSILILGIGVLFRVNDESKCRHVKYRIQNDEHNTSAKVLAQNTEFDRHSLPATNRAIKDSESNIDSYVSLKKDLPESDLLKLKILTGKSASDDVDILNDKESILPSRRNSLNLQEETNKLELDQKLDSAKLDKPIVTEICNTTNPTQIKRGKRGKAKKIATKYKDQDLEDRIAAQKVTGALLGKQKALAEAAAKTAREAELNSLKEKKKNQHEKLMKEIAQNEEIRQQTLQGQINDEGDNETLKILDTLFGRPMKEDKIVEAVPVCAPLTAMKDYKYKVKIQPGAAKKGKIAKEILCRWLAEGEKKWKIDEKSEDIERFWPRELELLKGWKFEEITGVIPVTKMRLILPAHNSGASKGNRKENTKGVKK